MMGQGGGKGMAEPWIGAKRVRRDERRLVERGDVAYYRESTEFGQNADPKV